MFKDSAVWCLAVRSARPADQAAWAPVVDPFRVRAGLLTAIALVRQGAQHCRLCK